MHETSQPVPESSTTYREQIALLQLQRDSLKLFGYVALLYLLVLLLLGPLFMAMLLPLTAAFRRLAYVSTPAYHLWGRMVGVKALPAQLAKPPTSVAIYSSVFVLVWLGLVAIMVRAMFFIGFCNQNLICAAGRLLLK